MGGWVGFSTGCCVHMQLPWLAVEWHWLAQATAFVTLLAQKRLLSLCRGTISGTVGSCQSGGVFVGRRVLTIESLLIHGCG